MTLPNATLSLGGEFIGTLEAALATGRLIGVSDAELNFVSTDGKLQQYNVLNGLNVWNFQLEPLLPIVPQMDKERDNSMDDGFVYDDGDNTTSIHLYTASLYNNETWTAFNGGAKNGQAPSKSNIVATEDLLYYTLDGTNSLEAYSHLTGDVFPSDLWAWTTMTGGDAAGETLASIIAGTSTKARFLGIASDTIVVETCKPMATITVENRTPQGDL
jgi:hypothetical protein